jgi:hypothetical protein
MSSNNVQKTPFQESLNRFFDEKERGTTAVSAKAMPASVVSIDASGTIVTVKFEVQDDVITYPNMKMPVFGPRFIRYPLRAGGDDATKGFVIPSDYYMGGMSGLGGGVANLTQRPNLSTYVFFPVGNTSNSETPFPNKTVIEGPEGVFLQTDDEETSLDLGYEKGGVNIDAPLGGNILKANWTKASSDADAKGKGIPYLGLYADPDGTIKWQRIPD